MNIFKQLTPDEWEIFSSYYLQDIGFSILEEASVGADGGKDLIVEYNSIKYIVSCKHYSWSRKKVTLRDEESILDRIQQHNVDGFIGFYSTVAADDLIQYLTNNISDYKVFGGAEILYNLRNINHSIKQSLLDSGDITTISVDENSYKPLLCSCGCMRDILHEDNIFKSVIIETLDNGVINIFCYILGHGDITKNKSFTGVDCLLNIEILNRWIFSSGEVVKGLTIHYPISSSFYRDKSRVIECLIQGIHPLGWRKEIK